MNSDEIYRVLEIVRKMTDYEGALATLRMFPEMEKYLVYAYAPVMYYGLTDKEITAHGRGDKQIEVEGFMLLRALVDKRLTGKKAVKIINAYIRTLTYRSGKVYKRILFKDLRIGIVINTARKLFPNSAHYYSKDTQLCNVTLLRRFK